MNNKNDSNNNLVESFYAWYKSTIRHPKWRWFIILGTGLYLVSPLDISPDIIPVVGWIDDGILATLLVTELSAIAMDYFKKNGSAEVADSTVSAEEGAVIDVEVS